MYKYFGKRLFDFIVALVALFLLSPVFLLTIVLLFVANNGKPFFLQRRPGRNGKIFKVIKFKTMNDRRDRAGNLLSDGVRLTSMGQFIRKTSLDEIPQLFNVLKGEMSIVGPRPLMVEYLPLYNDHQKRRHLVRPGITGWAQVNGRNSIEWQQKFELDVWYVDHVSFIVDMKIILLTIAKVLRSEGVSPEKSVTMERFLGNN